MTMNRRDFLKLGTLGAATAGAAATAKAVSDIPSPRELPGENRPRNHPPNPKTKINTMCNVCFWRCGVEAEIGEDGSLLHLNGNHKHPLSNGKLCGRGVGGIGMHYDPDRLKSPRIRRGARGQNVFRDATWDAALAETGRLLQGVIEEHGPGSVAFLTHGTSDYHFGHLAKAMGTPHHTGPAYSQCKGPRDVAFKLTFGKVLGSPEEIDLKNTKCVVLLGSHLGENMHNSQVQEFVTAKQNGAKVIVVDPRRSTAADKSDQWLQITPGRDMALLLAWIHILIRDEGYDKHFVAMHCSGFDELKEHVKKYTPEWASEETGLSVEEIESAARAIIEAGTEVVIHPGRLVVWYGDDTQRVRALAILVALTGSWGAKGGYYIPRRISLPEPEEAFPEIPDFPELSERYDPGYPFAFAATVNGIRQATLDGKIKAWVVAGTNVVHALPGEHETIAAINKLDAMIVVDILPTDITQYADVILPAASYLEHEDFAIASPNRDPFVGILQSTAAPVGQSRGEWDIVRDIAELLGLEKYFVWNSQKEYLDRVISTHNKNDPHLAVDVEELRREGIVIFKNSGPIYRIGHGLGPDGTERAGAPMLFPEWDGTLRTNRVRLYSPDLEKVYLEKLTSGENAAGFEPLPTYYRVRGGPPGHVRLNFGRSPLHSFSRTQNLPGLHGLAPENALWVSPNTAKAFGDLKDGQLVQVINQAGVEDGPIPLKVTSRIRDDSVYMTHGHGHNNRLLSRAHKRGANLNRLTTHYVIDPLSGATAMRVNFVRITRARGV